VTVYKTILHNNANAAERKKPRPLICGVMNKENRNGIFGNRVTQDKKACRITL
jgi:hypothetical protein